MRRSAISERLLLVFGESFGRTCFAGFLISIVPLRWKFGEIDNKHTCRPEKRQVVFWYTKTAFVKTMTARVLAHELRLRLYTVQVDKVVTKFMGETSAQLRQIFDLIEDEPGVYLFDEFDAIGGERSLDNDVGEMRRVLNAFLQFLEQDTSDSLIVAATNSPKLLDRALYRRFDDVLYYEYPTARERGALIQNVLGAFGDPKLSWTASAKAQGLSHAEIDSACRDAIKQAILVDQNLVEVALLNTMLQERQEAHLKRRE